MRIALLTNFIPPYRTPFFNALRQAAGELRVFVSTEMEGNRAWTRDWQGLDVVLQKTITLERRWRAQSFSENYEQHIPLDTWQQLKRYKPDLIITGEFGARSLQAVAFARATHTKVVLWATVTDRLEIQRSAVRKLLRRWLLRRTDAVIVNGESGARYIRRFGLHDETIIRMPYTTDLAQFLAVPIDRSPLDAKKLLYIGAISERKGVHLLLDAVQMLGVPITLVGDGPLKAELQSRHAGENVTWHDHLPYERLHEAYAAAGICVFPSLGDEWGLVVNEALASGLPVCGSTYSQAVEELVEDGRNGWTFEPTDARRIADAIERALLTSVDDLNAMRRQARLSVQDLTPQAAAQRLVNTLAG